MIRGNINLNKMKKAIILAGGLSLRMNPKNNSYFKNTMKSLLPIDGDTILGRIIRILKQNGILDIVLIVGYKKQELKRAFGKEVRYINDSYYKKEGMLDSLSCAMEEFNEPFLFLYADSLFTDRALEKIISSKKGDIVCLVCKKEFEDINDESEKIKISRWSRKIVRCSKELPNEEADGEFSGIIKLNKEGARKFKNSLTKISVKGKNIRDLIEFMIKKNIKIKAEIISSDDWMEMDFPEEYIFARDIFIKTVRKIDGEMMQKCKKLLGSVQ